jgi:hypothetical protein
MTSLALAAGLLPALAYVRAERPRVYALTNAKIVVAPGKVIEKGTIVLRDGLIEAVGAKVDVPADAVEIDATGKTVYPGLIDAYTNLGLRRTSTDAAPSERGAPTVPGFGQRRETPAGAIHPLSRVRPETQARHLILPFDPDNSKDAERYRNMGITTALVAPESGVFRGESALINLKDATPASELILKERVAQHVAFEHGGFGQRSYPSSLMGSVATFRQVLLDADRYRAWKKRYDAHPAGMHRPDANLAFEALLPVLDRARPVVFETTSNQDVFLVDRLAREFNLNAVIVGSGNEWEWLDRIKATGLTLILPITIPEKPKVDEGDEVIDVSLDELRRYVNAPENPKRLHDAGIKFALTTHGLKNPVDFSKNLRKSINAGLPAEAALTALTTVPAELFGVSSMLGTLEPGKIANLVVASGDLFAEKTKVNRVFVDGYEYKMEEEKKPKGDPTAVVDPRGAWSVVFEFPGGRSVTRVWTIKGTKGNYSGTAETQRGTVDFSNIQLEGNALTVTLPGAGGQGSYDVTVIITGDSFEGSAEQGRMTMTVKGTRTSGPDGGGI